jgi:uncharacterized protein YoxC
MKSLKMRKIGRNVTNNGQRNNMRSQRKLYCNPSKKFLKKFLKKNRKKSHLGEHNRKKRKCLR